MVRSPALNQWQLLKLATELTDTNETDDLMGPRLAQFDTVDPDVERGLNSLGVEQLRDLASLLTKVINAAEKREPKP